MLSLYPLAFFLLEFSHEDLPAIDRVADDTPKLIFRAPQALFPGLLPDAQD
jgi:hypothetical protein